MILIKKKQQQKLMVLVILTSVRIVKPKVSKIHF